MDMKSSGETRQSVHVCVCVVGGGEFAPSVI